MADAEPQRSLRILVVDDDADTRTSMAALLTLWGHTAVAVKTGAEALEAVAGAYDVVTFDLRLSDTTGCELARALRRVAAKPLYLIAITGSGREHDFRCTRDAGVDLHLIKPVAPVDLLEVLGHLV
jgi:CheY-like chemotaxis protein